MFKEIKPRELEFNAFSTIGDDWLLITAEKDGKVNTMTASWGGLGIMWGKTVAYIFIRPQRYTKEFVDAKDKLSLCVLPREYKKELQYFGTVSGRDEDKIAKSDLETISAEGTAYFKDSDKVFICNKLYAQDLKEEFFIQNGLAEKFYPQKDYHTMYVVEIEKVLVK